MFPIRRLAALTVILSTVGFTACKPPLPPPNVVVVLLDDARFDQLTQVADLKPDGGFDWIRDHGIQFDRIRQENNLCCPGRTTFLTGQTSHNHGQHDNLGYVDRQDTLPLWLQQKSYCTGFTGKYLNNYNETRPRPAGWTYWEPIARNTASEYGYQILQRDGTVATPGDYITDHLAGVSRAQQDDCLDQGKPAFTALWPFAPHYDADPEPAYENTPIPWTNSDPTYNETDTSDKPGWLNAAYPTPQTEFGGYTYDEWNFLQNERMVRSLLSVDDAVRALIDDLDGRGQLTKTVFVLTSDNGFLLGEHRLSFAKHLSYEAAMPPLWIAGPGFPSGATSDAYVANLDLAATILTAAKASHATDGRPIQNVLAEPDVGHDRYVPIYVNDVDLGPSIWPQADGIRTWRYKYVAYADGSEELYDLTLDPYEESSVHADPTYAIIRQAMIDLLTQARTCSGDTCRASAPLLLQA